MTKSLLKGALCVALAGMAWGCSDGYGPFMPSDKGKITIAAEVDGHVVGAPHKSKGRAEYTDVTAADLSIRLTAPDGSVQSWDRLSDFPTDQQFNIGNYTLEAFYGDEATDGFEAPYFYGSQDIKVRENQTTEVSLTAGVQNSLLDIDYTDSFKDYMTSWSAEVRSAAGSTTEYPADETRPVYVKKGKVEVYVDFVKPNGLGGKVTVSSFEAAPGHYYHLNIDLAGDGAGNASIEVTLDDTMAEQTVDIDISDEVLNTAAPALTADGFTAGETMEFLAGFGYENPLSVSIIAMGGLQQVTLTTAGASLLGQGWPAEVDLIGSSSATQQQLKSLGLSARGVFSNPEKMAVIDFAGVLGHIRYIEGGNNTTEFTVLVKDKFGKVSEPMTLTLEAQPVELTLASGSAYVGQEEFSIDFAYNAGEPSDVAFEYYNASLGVWRSLPTTVTALGRSASPMYRATASLSDTQADIKVRARAGSLTSNELVIERKPQVVARAEANSFATFAHVPVTIGPKDSDASLLASLLAEAAVYVSTDGTNYTAATTAGDATHRVLTVTGLTPATHYTAKIRNGAQDLGDCVPFAFDTESAAQIPNGNLDAGVTTVASASNWEEIQFDTWGTNNTMTTSQGSNYGYCRISGTIQTSDSHSGNAALIRSVGWGSGNTAVSSNAVGSGLFGKGICKYTDTGLLHLGATRKSRPDGYGGSDNLTNSTSAGPISTDDLECGFAFGSRPAAVKFWYKYSPKNSADKGLCEVWVKDAAGQVIASGTTLLAAASDYQQVSIPLSYAVNAAKGVSLYVKFLSSYDMEYLKRTNDNFSGPGNANTSRGSYMGSQLYIDDVELAY